jgi:hypothetical protein
MAADLLIPRGAGDEAISASYLYPYTLPAVPALDRRASVGGWAGGRSDSGVADVLPIFTVVDATQSISRSRFSGASG